MPICEIDPWRVNISRRQTAPPTSSYLLRISDAWLWNPNHRWVYDKLMVATRQGLAAAPHGIEPPQYPVFSKPIYNLKGMGVGSRALHSPGDYDAAYQPGHMWMPLLEGDMSAAMLRGRWRAALVGTRERHRGSRRHVRLLGRFTQARNLNSRPMRVTGVVGISAATPAWRTSRRWWAHHRSASQVRGPMARSLRTRLGRRLVHLYARVASGPSHTSRSIVRATAWSCSSRTAGHIAIPRSIFLIASEPSRRIERSNHLSRKNGAGAPCHATRRFPGGDRQLLGSCSGPPSTQSVARPLRLEVAAHKSREQADDEQDERDHEQNLRHACRGRSDTAEAEDAGQQRDHQKHQCPVQTFLRSFRALAGVVQATLKRECRFRGQPPCRGSVENFNTPANTEAECSPKLPRPKPAVAS